MTCYGLRLHRGNGRKAGFRYRPITFNWRQLSLAVPNLSPRSCNCDPHYIMASTLQVPAMNDADWDSVLQLVSQPTDKDLPASTDQTAIKPNDGKDLPANTPLAIPQLPTPPDSHAGSNTPAELPHPTPAVDENLVSVSTTFFPGAPHTISSPSDLVLLSDDSVWFYVNSEKLLRASDNNFNSLLPPSSHDGDENFSPIIAVPNSSIVLNIILHAIYEMSCAQYTPTFNSLSNALAALKIYGVSLHRRVAPSTPLFALLMSHAPIVPLPLYTLAASHDLYDLAAFTSSYMHSIPLSELTDEMAEAIGPVYLKRLFFLHYGRADALKRIIVAPPHPHAPTPQCDFNEQKKVTRAWALASAYLAWDARPDLPSSAIESALSPLGDHMTCELCRNSLRDRIKTLVGQWADIKRTI